MYKNFKINGDNRIYQSLKEKTEGATEVKWEVNGRSGTAYHLYVSNLKGRLEKIELHTAEALPGQPVSLRFRLMGEGNDILTLELPLLDYKGDWLSDWVVSAAAVITNFEKGDEVEIFTNQKTRDKSGRLYKSIYIKKNGEFTALNFKYTDTPKWVITEDTHKITKKVTKHVNKEAYDEYIMKYVNEAVEKFKVEGNEPTQNTPEPKATDIFNEPDDDDSSLPF